jgi:hypothetical protein
VMPKPAKAGYVCTTPSAVSASNPLGLNPTAVGDPDCVSDSLVSEPRCLVPDFDGASLSHDSKEALWDKFYTAAPPRRRQSVEQYKIVKRA